MKPNRNGVRRRRAAVLAEAVAAMAVFIPVIVLIVMGTVEASIGYVISAQLTRAANLAARGLAGEYSTNPGIASNTAQQKAVFSNVRIPGYVMDNSQFEVPAGGWKTVGVPPTVTVNCTYIPGVGNPPLRAFPSFDPLNLGTAFRIKVQATYRLY